MRTLQNKQQKDEERRPELEIPMGVNFPFLFFSSVPKPGLVMLLLDMGCGQREKQEMQQEREL